MIVRNYIISAKNVVFEECNKYFTSLTIPVQLALNVRSLLNLKNTCHFGFETATNADMT